MEKVEVYAKSNIRDNSTDEKIGKFWFTLTEEELNRFIDLLSDFNKSLSVGTVGFKDVNGNYNKNFTVPEVGYDD